MKVYVKKRYKDEINETVVDGVLKELNISVPYEAEYIAGNGRNIVVETENKVIFAVISRKETDSRNAFLSQYVPTVLCQYIEYKTRKQKEICIYLLNTGDGAKTDFILDTYKTAVTMGIRILNERFLNIPKIKPYSSFTEWKNAKTERRKYNPSNSSSYAIEDEDGYTVFGKLYGANGKEAAFTACLLARIAKSQGKKLNFVQVREHDVENVSDIDRKLLEYYGVNIAGGSIITDGNKPVAAKTSCRNQDVFKFNLLQKFGEKKCYLCGCDLETNIIASHIHRITDIDNSDLSEDEKKKIAVDGDNGFWLCANHDKMFEYGVITFDTKGNLVISDKLTENQKRFVKSITDRVKIEDVYLTPTLIEYLTIHNERVRLGI